MAVLALLYQFGLLGRAFWLAFSSLSWWRAGIAVGKLVGYVAPPPLITPQQALLIKTSIVLVASLASKLAQYKTACPSRSA